MQLTYSDSELYYFEETGSLAYQEQESISLVYHPNPTRTNGLGPIGTIALKGMGSKKTILNKIIIKITDTSGSIIQDINYVSANYHSDSSSNFDEGSQEYKLDDLGIQVKNSERVGLSLSAPVGYGCGLEFYRKSNQDKCNIQIFTVNILMEFEDDKGEKQTIGPIKIINNAKDYINVFVEPVKIENNEGETDYALKYTTDGSHSNINYLSVLCVPPGKIGPNKDLSVEDIKSLGCKFGGCTISQEQCDGKKLKYQIYNKPNISSRKTIEGECIFKGGFCDFDFTRTVNGGDYMFNASPMVTNQEPLYLNIINVNIPKDTKILPIFNDSLIGKLKTRIISGGFGPELYTSSRNLDYKINLIASGIYATPLN